MRRCRTADSSSSRTSPGISFYVNARLLDGFEVAKDGPTFDGAGIEVRFRNNADR
jgi:hypothetical protein